MYKDVQVPAKARSLPEGWKFARLGDLAESLVDGPFGSNLKTAHYIKEPGVRVVRLQNVQEGRYSDNDKVYVSDRYASTLDRNDVRSGDVLIAALGDDGHPVGRACCYPEDLPNAINKADCFRLRAVAGQVEGAYVMRCLNTGAVRKQVRAHEQGVTRQRINLVNLRSVEIRFPPLLEQQKVLAVLDTLDTAIRQTEAIIAKLKQVKQGLLHDLLTRGIDANGELRPPQSQAPHLYKDSPLGWIPREWDVCGVLDIAPTDRQCILTGPFGAQLGQGDFVAEGVPVLRIGNVQAGFIDWSDVQFVSHAKAGRLERFSVLPGDLLFARQGATTGRNALADERADGALINYHIIRVAVDRDRCVPVYLHALFNSHQSKGQVDQEKGRGTREGINSKQIAALRFALPQIEEQRMLVARLTLLQVAMDQESLFVAKLRLQKHGLMDDLLTGRVRVTPLLTTQHSEGSA